MWPVEISLKVRAKKNDLLTRYSFRDKEKVNVYVVLWWPVARATLRERERERIVNTVVIPRNSSQSIKLKRKI